MWKIELLKTGKEGKVYSASTDKERCAIKMLKIDNKIVDGVENLFELDLWSSLHHGNVLCVDSIHKKSYFGVSERSVDRFIVKTRLMKSDIFDYSVEREKKTAVIKQLVTAVDYCHSKNIIHCDIKEENVLIDENHNICLCDFGHSIRYNPILPWKGDVGTEGMRAKEILTNETVVPKTDIFALAVLIFNFWKGNNSKKDIVNFEQKSDTDMARIVKKEITDEFVRDLLLSMLKNNAEERSSAEELMIGMGLTPSSTRDQPKVVNYHLDDEMKADINYILHRNVRTKKLNCAIFFGVDLFFRLRESQLEQKKRKRNLFLTCLYMGHKFWFQSQSVKFSSLFGTMDNLPTTKTVVEIETSILSSLNFKIYNQTPYERGEIDIDKL